MTKIKAMSKQAFKRLPIYMNYLKSLEKDEIIYVSSPTIAKALDLNEIQVRKDLAIVCESQGVPKKGFIVEDLMKGISNQLGYNNSNEAILVGAGQLGMALMSYKGFENYGIHILAAFDTDESLIDNKRIFHISKIPNLCNRLNIKIGIITTPASVAQETCDKLIESGILAIWNFAPTHLKVNNNILVQNENMASSLALLSNHLRDKLDH